MAPYCCCGVIQVCGSPDSNSTRKLSLASNSSTGSSDADANLACGLWRYTSVTLAIPTPTAWRPCVLFAISILWNVLLFRFWKAKIWKFKLGHVSVGGLGDWGRWPCTFKQTLFWHSERWLGSEEKTCLPLNPEGNERPVAFNTSPSLSFPPLPTIAPLHSPSSLELWQKVCILGVDPWRCEGHESPVWNGNPTQSALPGSTRNIPTEMAKGNGTSEKKIAIFIEVFLSKTRVSIKTTLPIQDVTLCNTINLSRVPTDHHRQRSVLSTHINSHSCIHWQHMLAQITKKKNMITEMNVIHEKR